MRRPRGIALIGIGRMMNPMGRTTNAIQALLGLIGLRYLADASTYMLYPAGAPADKRHYLYIPGTGWVDQCPLTAGSMAATGEITGGSQSVYTANTVESFSIIWNNSCLPVVAFSIGFNRSLTAAERTALSATAFWAQILPAAINTANCTALYPWLAPDYQNIVGWWDATAVSGSNLDPISSISDKSGLGNHATQSTVDFKPSILANHQNGNQVASFAGNDFLIAHAVSNHFTGSDKPATALSVLKRDAVTSYEYVVAMGNAASATPRFCPIAYPNSGRFYPFKRDDAEDLKGVWAATAATQECHLATSRFKAATVSAWINGPNVADEIDSDVGAITLDTFSLGAYITNNGAQSWLTGWIGEVVLYKSALSAADILRIERYLVNKWGITVGGEPLTIEDEYVMD